MKTSSSITRGPPRDRDPCGARRRGEGRQSPQARGPCTHRRVSHPWSPGTLELARALGLDTTEKVLDVGSGVGRPSRCIAREFGCRVIGIDLTDEHCIVATMLAERVSLSHLGAIDRALGLPYNAKI